MKRCASISSIILYCLLLQCSLPVLGRVGTGHPNGKKAASHFISKKIAWNANAPEEKISAYIIYEKVEKGKGGPSWKPIGTTPNPEFTVPKLTPGSYAFAVRA